jgi:hypothetical protein
VIDAILKLQKKIERESPLKRILEGPAELDESGTGRFVMAPNGAVKTRRLGTYVSEGGLQADQYTGRSKEGSR